MFRLAYLLLFVAIATVCCSTVRADEVVEDDEQGTRIKGGSRTSQEEVPYVVSMQLRKLKFVTTKFCAGVIIDPDWILTAAHCVDHHAAYVRNQYKELYIVAGVQNAFDLEKAQIRLVEKAFKHPNYKVYNNHTAVYDIALLKLKSSLDLGPLVRNVELPDDEYKTESSGVISGWGATTNPPKIHQSQDLLSAKVDIVPNESCGLLNDAATQLCAGGKDINACGGDSGGPLVQSVIDGARTVVGITSYGEYGCGDQPAVFTKVAPFTDFIRTTMEEN